MQQLDEELILDGEEELEDREVSDGTFDSSSESMKESESESESCWWARRLVRASSVALSYWVLMTWRVSCGRCGRGAAILSGERARPLGIDAVLTRRECDDLDDELDDEDFLAGMSRMLSLRPVVGSVVNSRAGS